MNGPWWTHTILLELRAQTNQKWQGAWYGVMRTNGQLQELDTLTSRRSVQLACSGEPFLAGISQEHCHGMAQTSEPFECAGQQASMRLEQANIRSGQASTSSEQASGRTCIN